MTPTMISTAEALFKTNVESVFPALAYAYSGEANPDTSLYARFWVLTSDETLPVGFGQTARNRNVGVVQIDVLGPKDRGAGETGDIAYAMGKWFARSEVVAGVEGKITFKEATIKDWGTVGEAHRQTVSIPYWYDFQP